VSLDLYVEDVDAFVKKALAAGAKERTSSRISSTATAPASSKTPSGISGGWPLTRKGNK
jgi:hypothetical protein